MSQVFQQSIIVQGTPIRFNANCIVIGTGTNNLVGSFNTIVGHNAGTALTTPAQRNTLYGFSAGANITTGNNNVCTGTSLTALATGNDQTLVGNFLTSSAASTTIIGNSSNVSGTNGISIGRSNTVSAVRGICLGRACTASGDISISIGDGTVAASSGSIAMGLGASAGLGGEHSIAIGTTSVARNESIAIGQNAHSNTVSGSRSIAFGAGAIADEDDNISIGQQSLAQQYGSISVGNSATTTGRQSTAIGSFALASADYGLALGTLTSALRERSIAIGYSVISNDDASISLGSNCSISGTLSITIGTDLTIKAERATLIGYSGYNGGTDSIAIGTKVLIDDGSKFCTVIGNETRADGGAHNNVTCLGNGAVAVPGDDHIVLGDGNIGRLYCNATVITALSDERDKTNVRPITNAREFIDALNPVSFDWDRRDGTMRGKSDLGFIAQELLLAQESAGLSIPNLVDSTDSKRLGAAYAALIPVIVQAIKILSAEIRR